MLTNYVLYPFVAQKYHQRWNLHPSTETYVGFLGHKLYSTILEDISILRKLQAKSARPVYMSIARRQDTLDVSSLEGIIKGYFLSLTGQSVNCQVVANAENTLFYPLFEGHFLYAHDDEEVFFRDLTPFLGRSYLSHSLLALEYQIRENRFFGLKYEEGVLTYDNAMNFLVAREEMLLRQTEITTFVEEREEHGFVSYPTHSLDGTLLLELAETWALKKKITPQAISVVGVPYEEPSFYTDLERDIPALVASLEEAAQPRRGWVLSENFTDWVEESVLRIQLGKSPVYRTFVTLPEERLKNIFPALVTRNPLLATLGADVQFVSTSTDVKLERSSERSPLKADAEHWSGYVQYPVLSPEDLFYLQALLRGEEISVKKEEIKPIAGKVAFVDGQWFAQTTHGDFYLLPEKAVAVAASKSEDFQDKEKLWKEGAYATPWGRYAHAKLGIYSTAFLK